MRSVAVLSVLVATAWAQGVTQYIAPKGKPPSGCVDTRPGKYELSVEPLGKKKRDAPFPPREKGKTLQVTLNKGLMKDGLDRTGYIADNYQFQFDGPPQAGSIFTGGWSFCSNGSLALGNSALFYQCLSGDFYNLYDRWWADQCKPITIQLHAIGGAAANDVSSPAPTGGLSGSLGGSSGGSSGGGAVLSGGKPAAASNTILATGDKPTASASVTLTNTSFVSPNDASATAASLSSVAASVSSAASSISASASKSASASSASASASSTAKSSNAAQMVDSKAPTVALLMGVLGMVMI